ncbi:unnamed protein product [Peronospora belbahrii]|uniref:Uncharacterized protein n=1 Tax=Peronospora belbahrii TaxID=622444 RepID=A0AAU9L9U2_9STRA|nr:unnamed protein product [Peronospora belbahrii]
MTKISALAVAAAIAIANVSAADQPALRSAAMPVETASSSSMTTPDGDKKEYFWGGGPWGGLGWGGGWGCCGGLGWGGGLGLVRRRRMTNTRREGNDIMLSIRTAYTCGTYTYNGTRILAASFSLVVASVF